MFKKTFSVNDLELAIVKPTQSQLTEANMKYNVAFNEAVKSKAPLRDEVDDILREQGLWGDDRQLKFDKPITSSFEFLMADELLPNGLPEIRQ